MGVDGEYVMEGGEGACEDRRFVDARAHNLKLSHATYFRRPLFPEVSLTHFIQICMSMARIKSMNIIK